MTVADLDDLTILESGETVWAFRENMQDVTLSKDPRLYRMLLGFQQ